MPPRKYELYLARIPVGESDYARPWLVVSDPSPHPSRPDKVVVTAVPLSSALDLFRERTDFLIRETDGGFGSTGLKRDSYVIGDLPAFVDVTLLRRRLGELSGEILEDFKSWGG